jgi:hypothetical protein
MKLKCKLQKLQELNSGIEHYGVDKRIHKSNSVLVIILCGFPRVISHTKKNLLGNGLDPT